MYKFISEGVSKDSISRNIQGEYVEDGVSGATLTITDSILSIAMPSPNIEDEVERYFQEEEILLNLVGEALQILNARRDDRKLQRKKQYCEKCYKLLASKLPGMDTRTVRALRELIADGALPVGGSKFDNDHLLKMIENSLQSLEDAAD